MNKNFKQNEKYNLAHCGMFFNLLANKKNGFDVHSDIFKGVFFLEVLNESDAEYLLILTKQFFFLSNTGWKL